MAPLEELEKAGRVVQPSPATIRIIQVFHYIIFCLLFTLFDCLHFVYTTDIITRVIKLILCNVFVILL